MIDERARTTVQEYQEYIEIGRQEGTRIGGPYGDTPRFFCRADCVQRYSAGTWTRQKDSLPSHERETGMLLGWCMYL